MLFLLSLLIFPFSEAGSTQVYKVRKGDTLYKISKRFNVPVREIKSANHLTKDRLKPGQRLLLPKGVPQEKARPQDLLDGADGPEEIVDLTNQAPLGRWESEKDRHLLVRVAKSFIGAPYKLGGETVKGMDCSAFVRKIYAIFGLDLPRSAREQFKLGSPVAREDLLPGDLVFFRTNRFAPHPTHVGIYIGDGNFIHAAGGRRRGVTIDSLSSDFFSRTYVGAKRLMDSEDFSQSAQDRFETNRKP